ncbi:alpha/beta fold hydrolase [Pseudoalteromonas luteoviolacea]|uniref:alpha/beta fold hydrolase n=1 Tax=Pseudoalteromonas luteoviolacea TaxID=43657 RepID=UPI0011527F88|nr:alpha/beta hydrolase [Pseudoalteromonas luteoviolacea]TQF67384.1 alpha/beta hydrolase [Pseudoalteromonas luteoviolacea]
MLINKKNEMKDYFEEGFAWQQIGKGSVAVICLHGWLDNGNSYQPLVGELAQSERDNYTWYLLDLPGHGQSNWKSTDAGYYFVEYVYDVIRFMKAANITEAHFIGHSMGALIANLFTSLYPDKVLSLGLIDGIGLIYQGSASAKQNLLKAFRARDRASSQETRWFDDRQSIIKARASVSDFDESLAQVLMSRSIKCENGQYALTSDPRVKLPSTMRFNQEQAYSLLDKISVDTMLILPEHGYPQMRDNMRKFLSCFDRVRVVEVAGGHHCHMENPKQILKEIVSHIEKQGAC